jgi:rhodanese-related sulfurtransferase
MDRTNRGEGSRSEMIKKAAEMVAEANAAVDTLSIEDAKRLVGQGDVQFVDVRETGEFAQGRVPGAVHAPRGMLEFMTDPTTPFHKPELASGKRLVVYCASGGRGALAAKTLKDRGVAGVNHMLGGFGAWQQAGGEIER